jgi:2-keto-4-pentenoate hydratase/2-oxohepta-3-ene-1,7-dioic acid hydratase in catechol pathway
VKLARLDRSGQAIWAAVDDRGGVDLTPVLGPDPRSIRDHLLPDGLARLSEFACEADPDIAPDGLVFEACLPEPRKIVCVGVNYRNRNEEYRDGSELPKYPSLFFRSPTSFAAHDQPLVRPKESEQLDYEGEIVIVIGKGGRRIAREEAAGHIAGLSLMNEGTIRDWVRHAKFNVTQGKNFDRSGAIGPWIVTADEIGEFDSLKLETRVNGELRQDDSTANLIFPFDYLIEYVSSFMTLEPGDIISTGTPPGAGARFDPPIYLKPGDVVEVSSPSIGTLRNGIVDG